MGSNLGTNLTGIDYVFLVVPVALVLATWIFAVLRADTHPDVRHVGSERGQIHGGSRLPGTGFEAEPIPGEAATGSVLATGAADESSAGERQAAQSAAATESAGAPAGQQTAREGRDSG
jgi:hypothetical protein